MGKTILEQWIEHAIPFLLKNADLFEAFLVSSDRTAMRWTSPDERILIDTRAVISVLGTWETAIIVYGKETKVDVVMSYPNITEATKGHSGWVALAEKIGYLIELDKDGSEWLATLKLERGDHE